MHKKQSKQITIEDFYQPAGLNMSRDKRWIRKAEIILWDDIEQEYAKHFRGIKGNVAKKRSKICQTGFGCITHTD